MKEKIKENKDKVKVNKTLPYLVANVIELLDVEGDDQEEDGANVDLDAQVRVIDNNPGYCTSYNFYFHL